MPKKTVLKKKVTTRKAAQSFAKRTGAKLDIPPVNPKPIKKPASKKPADTSAHLQTPAPAAVPAPVPIIDQSQVVAAIEGASANTQKVLLDLARQIEEIRQQMADRPTEWIFDWEYLNNGRIKRIKASVPDIKRLLN